MLKKILSVISLILLIIVIIFILNSYEKTRIIIVDTFSKPLINNYNNREYKQYLALKLTDYPDELTNMLLLVEDQAFFNHSGIDIRQIYFTIKGYLFNNKKLRGASTITQQLIKNTLLTREISFKRKITEIIMAFILEDNFSKKYILLRYINSVNLGQNGAHAIYGFGMASYFYFNKRPKDMSLDEMALLVSLLKGPSYYNPKRYKIRLQKRKKLVLKIFNKYEKIYPR